MVWFLPDENTQVSWLLPFKRVYPAIQLSRYCIMCSQLVEAVALY